jgi:hypothetical protein
MSKDNKNNPPEDVQKKEKSGKKGNSMVVALVAIGIIAMAAVILIFLLSGKNDKPKDMIVPQEELPSPTPATGEPSDENQNELDAEPVEGIDAAAMYALHDPDEVVMTVGGKDITWRDYFYFYNSNAQQQEQMFQYYMYYGMAVGWEDQADEEHTYAERLPQDTEDILRQLIAVETLAEELGVTLTEEEEAEVQEAHQDLITSRFGEEGTEEDLFEFLETIYVSPELYWRLSRFSYLHEGCYRALYGEEGEKLEEQEILDWMQDNGVVSADHILLATIDLSTREALDEAAVAEKAELAQKIAAELQAIEDPEARIARFAELKEENNEDPGTENGYVFGPGVMVQEFYDGALALEPDQVSDPVKSDYGYHIILRRPIHVDDEILSGGGTYAAREAVALEKFNSMLQERVDNMKVKPVGGFQAPNILDYYHKAVATE